MEPSSWAGGVAAILAAVTLLVGIAGMVRRSHRGRPWLVVLFGINAGYGDVSPDTLRAVQPVDVLLLLLAGVTYIGFWPGPGASQAVWMSLAIAQPLLGIAILLATHLWGRSGLMGGALVLSILMVVDGTWTATGWLGVTASFAAPGGRLRDDWASLQAVGGGPRGRLWSAGRLVRLGRCAPARVAQALRPRPLGKPSPPGCRHPAVCGQILEIAPRDSRSEYAAWQRA